MKKIDDPRHQKRIRSFFEMFSSIFYRQKLNDELAEKVLAKRQKIDQLIGKAAPDWPVDKIAPVDLSILRLAVYELTVARKEPPKVIIDEAIEIAKEFGGETSPKFVNGVLGKILSWMKS